MFAGQLVTMLAMAGSGVQSIRAGGLFARHAFQRGGHLAHRGLERRQVDGRARAPFGIAGFGRAHQPSMVRAGEARATAVSRGTGQAARWPASGSRIMPLKKLEAAPLGLPGRTLTVISRTLRPRMKPLRA
jgi:hypothetical protein